MNVKQVLVVRQKYPDKRGGVRSIRAGKLMAQAAHGAMSWMVDKFRHGQPLTEVEKAWLFDRMTKVCCKVDTEEELLALAAQAHQAGVKCHIVTDMGLTEFDGECTMTCIAIGPDLAGAIDPITGHLSLC